MMSRARMVVAMLLCQSDLNMIAWSQKGRVSMVVAMLLCHCHPRQTSAPAVPFSFLLGGAAVDLSRWSTSSNITQLDGVRTQTTISFAHPRQQGNSAGLKAQLQRTDYLFSHGSRSEQSSAEELLLRFHNDGATDSPLLCDVSTLDRTWPLAASAAATLHTNGGSFARVPPEFDYSPGIRDVPLGANISISPEEGMSSDGVMPWFALELSSDGRGGGGGAVLSLGWTGNWRLRVTRSTRGVRLRASVGDLCATIHPGEMFRVLRVLLVPVVSRAAAAGQPALRKTSETALRAAMNLHRRVLVDYKVPRKPSDHTAFQGALTASWTWGAWPAPELNESGQQQHIAWIDQIGADAWWLDAGWFNAPPGSIGRTGSFPSGIGNWRLPASDSINKTMFPRGLAPLSTAARAKGLRSVVWFDIEGVFPETTIWNMTHKRDLCFRDFASGRRCQLADSRSLLNLGNNRTWQYLLDFSTSAIEEYRLDVFRLDYNVGLGDEPCAMLPCWRAADSPTRKGMAEVSYVQGLYDLWDALLTRFASRDLFLDNCAGGGRRIDLETSSRSVPLWRTDAGCPSAEASQAMTMGISVVLPISSGATCGKDSTAAIEPYMWRSAGVVGKVISWGPATWQAIVRDQKLLALARAAVAETKRIRPIAIEGDYYALTAINVDDRTNVAYQFHRDRMGHNDGVVCVFHRSRAPAEFSIQLQGVEPAATYQLQFSRNYSVEKNVTMLGAQMRSAVGLSFKLSNAQQMPRIGSFSSPRMQNATRLWGSLAGPTFHAATLVDCVNACARLGAVCEGATLTLSTTGTGARICYPLKDISRVQFEDAPGYASVLHHDVCVGTQTRQCSGSMLIEYTQVKTPTPTGSRPVLVAENEAVAGKKLISIFPSSLHTVPGDGGLFLSVAGVHDGTLGNGREFFSKDAVDWEEVSPNCSAQANCHRPAGGNDSTFPLFQAAPCVPRQSDASLLCWPKRLDLVGDPTNSTEGRVAAQRWSGEPIAISNWETVTYKTDIPFGRSGSFENKFAVVADGDPPVALKNGSGWLLTAYASRASSDLTFILLAMFSRDGILWEQRAIIKNSSGIGPVLPKIPGRPCFDKGCTNQACANPNESTLTRLADGSLAVFYRNGNELSTDYAENVPLCVQFSYDEGTSWSAPHVVSPPPPPPPPGPPPPPLGPCSILRSFGCQKDLNCAHNRSSRCLRGTGAKGLGQTGAKTGVGTSHTECACACHSRGFTLAGLEGGACFCDHGAAPDPAQCGKVAPANQSRVCADSKTIPGERGGFCAVEVFSFHCPSNASCAPTPPPPPARSDGPKGVEPRSAITARGQLVVVSGRDGLFAWMVGLAQIVDGPWTPFNIAEHHNMFYGNQTVNTTCGEETLAFPPETVLGTKRAGATSGYMGITRLGDALVICYDHMLHCAGTTRVYCFQLSDV